MRYHESLRHPHGYAADVRLFEYERYPLPREGDDVVGETHGAWNAADNVAGAVRGVFFHEGLQMPCGGESGSFAVLDLHGDELSAALDHPVHFRTCGISPEPNTGGGNRVAPDMAEKFKPHELFELPSFFHFGRVDAFPCRDAADAGWLNAFGWKRDMPDDVRDMLDATGFGPAAKKAPFLLKKSVSAAKAFTPRELAAAHARIVAVREKLVSGGTEDLVKLELMRIVKSGKTK